MGVSNLRILVVEDYEDAAVAQAELLRAWGHRVCVATDALVALILARDFQPDVVLLDIQLSDKSGIVRELRSKVTRPIDIVALTGLASEEARGSSAAGMDYVFLKPLRAESLREVLMLASRRNPMPSRRGRLLKKQRSISLSSLAQRRA